MIVRKDHGRRVMLQGFPHYFPRVHARLGQRPAEEILDIESAILRIEPPRDEDFRLAPQEVLA
jgi:hypothetical protein